MFSSKFNIYRNEWLDLVFADRNQSYGAYVLRKDYGKTLTKALFIVLTFFSSLLFLSLLTTSTSKTVKSADTDMSVRPADELLKAVAVELPPQKKEVKPAPAVKSEPVKIETKRFVDLKVVPAVEAAEEMPTIEDLEKAVIGQINTEGEENEANKLPVENTGGDGGIFQPDGAGDNVYSINLIEKYPEFPGGMDAFAKFLRKNLHYPSLALENGISGRVTISFIVEKDGRLTDIKILRGIGFGCDEEAVRVLKKSPLWIPGIQNKQKVRVQYIVPVVFRTE